MTDIAIDANLAGAMAVNAPAHCLIHFATDAVRLPDIAVAGSTVYARPCVRLVRKKDISLAFKPVNAFPGRLLFSIGERSQLLNLRALCLCRLMTRHARVDIWNRSVSGLVHVFVTERALETRGLVVL